MINYRPGKKNGKADALSRYPIDQDEDSEDPIPTVVAAITDEVPSQARELNPDTSLRDRQHSDPQLSPTIQFLENDTVLEDPNYAKLLVTEKSRYSIIKGVLYHVVDDGSLHIIPPSQDRRHLFDSAHAGLFAGHLREKKIYGTLSKHYWWMYMRRDISTWCKSCLTCATRQVGRPIRPCLLPIPVEGPFDRVGVDVLQLPKSSRGNQYAVVFMDYLTKWPEVYPVRDQTAPTIARLLVEKIVCRHGKIQSDRGANFLSGLLQEMYTLLGTHMTSTTAYHPRTDGLVERFNRTLLEMLSK